jgi:hypothetical protein
MSQGAFVFCCMMRDEKIEKMICLVRMCILRMDNANKEMSHTIAVD